MNTRPVRLRLLCSLGILLVSGSLFAQDVPVRDWEVPSGELDKLGGSTVGLPAPFSAISPPCRLYDSRVTSGGPGPIPGSGTRAFDFIPAGSPACGALPSASVLALSLYITVVNPLGPGFIYAFPTGNVPATPTSIINYNGTPGELRNNAAILAVSGGGSFTIGTGGAGTDIIIDINGIFYSLLESPDFFQIAGSRAGGVITATNFGSAANTYGVSALIGSSAGVGSAAVYGTAIGNAPVALYGGRFDNDSTATNSAAVLANSDTASGEVYGLLADNDSDTAHSAGVWGRSGTNAFPVPTSINTYGVLGTSMDSGATGNTGVLGVAQGGSTAAGVQGIFMQGGVVSTNAVLGFSGNVGVYTSNDLVVGGVKLFVEPHPTDPSREIAYVSLEGPEAGTYFRGRGRVQNGLARIPVPESFRLVSEPEDLSIQAIAIGEMATFAVLRIDLNEIVVKGSRNVEFFYTVNGVRKGHGDFQAIRKNEFFRPASPTDKMIEWPLEVRARLIANGTLTREGTPNLETAERLGWKAEWEKAAAESKARREEEAPKGGIR
jgi:hypothetical protein